MTKEAAMSGQQSNPAISYLLEIVEPTAAEFLQNVSDKRHGFLAAIVLSHMVDHNYHAQAAIRSSFKSPPAYRAHLSPHGSDFALVCDVANVAKHSILVVVPKHRALLFERADDVGAAEPNFSDASLDFSDTAFKFDGSPMVFVVFPDGRRAALHPSIRRAVAMWRKELGLPPHES